MNPRQARANSKHDVYLQMRDHDGATFNIFETNFSGTWHNTSPTEQIKYKCLFPRGKINVPVRHSYTRTRVYTQNIQLFLRYNN